MPHKRAKRSVREAKSKELGYNNAPTATDSASNPSKTMMRILNAEKVREEHRKKQRSKQQAEERGDFTQDVPQAESSKAAQARDSQKKLQIREGESLKAFSRRAEESLRGDINSAMRSASKKSNKEIDEASSKKKRKRETPAPEPAFKHQPVDQRIAEKRARAAERAGKPVPQEDDEEERDFASVTRVGVNDVAEAPPSLDKFIKMQKSVGPSGNNKGGSRVGLSLAQQEALEQQRQEAILRYREIKQSKMAS